MNYWERYNSSLINDLFQRQVYNSRKIYIIKKINLVQIVLF